VRSLTTGEAFSCAVDLSGLAICSGSNQSFEVYRVKNPPPVTGYSVIAAGQRHACGMPRYDGTSATQVPFCWGENSSGQLGRDTATFQASNQTIAITMPLGVTAFDSLSLVAGASHTCAITAFLPPATEGTAYCWGGNAYGQLGNGAQIAPGGRSAVPIPVFGGTTFARLYAGENHTCGIRASGVAFCWGRNDAGQLGIGNTTNTSTPTAVAGGLAFRRLALGELHTCGVTGAGPSVTGTTSPPGTMYCWGDNEFGQLGLGVFGANGLPSTTPQVVVFQQ
jgi:alpha-tubulin suppressor-like RCC1 family protein